MMVKKPLHIYPTKMPLRSRGFIEKMIELKAEPRAELGRKTNALRRAGFLPAVLYGEGTSSQPIAIPYKDFEKAYKEAGESTLLELDVGGKKYNVLIHDLARDPLKGKPLHADFYAVRMDKPIRAKIPIEFSGESPAVKNFGGILIKVVHEVEVESLPRDLPPHLKIDLSSLEELESRICLRDLSLPQGVTLIANPDDAAVIVEPPRSEEELKSLEEKVKVEPVEVKTEREVKEEVREAEKTPEEKEGGGAEKKGI